MYYFLAAIVAFVSYFLYKCYIYPLYLSPLSKIPGPPVNNIIIGHLSSLKKDSAKSLFNLAKQYGGITRFHALLNKPHILIADPKLAKTIFISRAYDFVRYNVNAAVFKDLIGDGVLLAEGVSHKRQRKAMNPIFTFANTKLMTPTFIQAGHNLNTIWMKEIGNKREERITISDAILRFNYEFNSTTTETELEKAYDFVTKRNPTPLYVFLTYVFPFIRKLPTQDNNNFYAAVNTINNIAEKLLASQKNSSVQGTDLLSLMVKENDKLPVNEQLTHGELLSSVMTFLMAGHDTSSVVLSWALYLLAKNPDIQDRLRKETLDIFHDRDYHPTFDQIEQMKFLDCTVKEVLRFITPVPQLSRVSTKDEMFNGYFIPKNTPFIISLYSIHHDPSIWGDDVEDFNPSRWLNPEVASNVTSYNFIPFSAGPRICVGVKMATLELKCMLAVIIRNLKFKLVEGFTFEVKSVSVSKPLPGIDLFVSKVDC
ncbi:7731_t:CDS:2 [Cetraspora pellucida]|uniref:7731_t:CDS:1 n=1 Tax=Cetraspora pellucida TaxID=1433469 RepID=A0ACA9MJK7_9GLOM|nr:7731_t:CDS:2 [Cetraspora pellucida]